MLTALEHCTIRTTRLSETRRFFEDILGLRIGPRPALSMPGFWLYIGDAPVIHLMEIGAGYGKDPFDQALQQEDGSGSLDHLAFRAQDLQAFLDRLAQLNIEHRRASIPEMALEQVFLKDPNGIIVELNFKGNAENAI